MTHLDITQNTGYIEEINSSIISKLYEIASSGNLDLTSNLTGRLHTPISYKNETEYLTNNYPNLYITSDEYRIRFEDPTIVTYLNAIDIGSNGVITESLAANAIIVANGGNQNTVKFNELRYFTRITESSGGFNGTTTGRIQFSGWGKLEEIDISNFVSIGHNSDAGPQDSFYNCPSLKTVTASNKLRAIGHLAFLGCIKLETISGLSGEITIGYRTFANCTKLTSNNFENVEFITGTLPFSKGGEFYLCTSLTELTFSSQAEELNQTFLGCTNLRTIHGLSNILRIVNKPFYNCPNLQTVELDYSKIETIKGSECFKKSLSYNLPTTLSFDNLQSLTGDNIFRDLPNIETINSLGTITSIPNNTFWDCKSLLSVTFPNTLENIGNSAFYDCNNLTTLNNISNCNLKTIGGLAFLGCQVSTPLIFNEGLTSIRAYAFYSNKVPSVSFPSTLKIIPDSCFRSNKYLTQVTFSEGLETIEVDAFREDILLTTMSAFPSTLKSIGNTAFYSCTSLTSINLDNTALESIGINAFNSCTNAASAINIPGSCTIISAGAFAYCRKITSLTVGNGVTSIGNNAFDGCRELTSVTLGNTLTDIGKCAFLNCDKLTSIVIPSGITEIKESTFLNCYAMTSATIPNGVTSIGYKAFNTCNKLISMTLPSTVTSIGAQAFAACSALESINIPSGVTRIEDSTFCWCTKLNNITIPNSVTSIDNNAFWGCSGLTSVTIPNNVTSIGNSAFRDCSGLTSVTIGSGVTSIGERAFGGCSGLTSVTIPNNVTSIGDRAFAGTRISSIEIPNSVISIGNDAFDSRNLVSLTVRSITPPSLGNSFVLNNLLLSIYVPAESVDTYKQTEGWSVYADKIQAIPND